MNVEEINKKKYDHVLWMIEYEWFWWISIKNNSIAYIINCSVMILLNEYRKWNANKKDWKSFFYHITRAWIARMSTRETSIIDSEIHSKDSYMKLMPHHG